MNENVATIHVGPSCAAAAAKLQLAQLSIIATFTDL